nr:hypothetical protein [Tanacetum cinerariifolium]
IASPEVIPEFHDSKGCTLLSEELSDIDSFNDIHPYFDDDTLSGSTTYSADSEIEFLLFQCEDSDLKDLIDQSVLTHCDDLFVDPTPEMFIEEQHPDYSFPPRFDVYPDDFLEIESYATFDDDYFDSEGEKIKKAELLIDPLDLPCDILSEYDSWLFGDFDPPFSELLFFKEVPISMRLLLFSSKNEEKFLNQGFTLLRSFIAVFSLNYLIQIKQRHRRSKLKYKFQDEENSEDIFSYGSALEDISLLCTLLGTLNIGV